jgi:hypothetical protein
MGAWSLVRWKSTISALSSGVPDQRMRTTHAACSAPASPLSAQPPLPLLATTAVQCSLIALAVAAAGSGSSWIMTTGGNIVEA